MENTKEKQYTLEDLGLTRSKRFLVYAYNDNVTPMDYVVDIFMNIFSLNIHEAMEKMLHIHECGCGIVQEYSDEETPRRLLNEVKSLNAESGYQLVMDIKED